MLEIAGALWPGWSGSSSTNPAYRITAIGRGARAEASDEVRKAGDLRRRPGPSVPRPSGPAGADRPGYREAGWRHQDGQESGRRRGRGGHRLGHELRDTVSRVDLGRNRVDRTIPVGEVRPGGSRKRYGGGRRPDLGPRHRRHHQIRLGAPVAARTISVGRNITGIVVGAGSVWVTVDAP